MVSCPLDRWIQAGQTHLTPPRSCFPSCHLCIVSSEEGPNLLGEQCAFPCSHLILVSLHLLTLPTSLSSQTALSIIIKAHAHRTSKPHPSNLEACRKDLWTPQMMKWSLKVLRQGVQSQVWWLTLVIQHSGSWGRMAHVFQASYVAEHDFEHLICFHLSSAGITGQVCGTIPS